MIKRTRVINPMTGQAIPWQKQYMVSDTILLFGIGLRERSRIQRIAAKKGFKIYGTDNYIDIFAIPSKIAVINPAALIQEEMETVVGFWNEAKEKGSMLIFSRELEV